MNLERDGYTVLEGAVPADAVNSALRALGLGIRRLGIPGGQAHADCQGGTFLPVLRDDPAIWALLGESELDHLRDDDPWSEWAEPQIMLRFPDEAPGEVWVHDVDGKPCPGGPCTLAGFPRPAFEPHVDEEPPWAGHEYLEPSHPLMDACQSRGCRMPEYDPIHVRRRYKAIVGVALTDNGVDDGALYVWPGSHIPGTDEWPRTPGREPVAVPLKAGDAVILHPKLAHAGSLNLGHTWQARVYFRLLGA